MNKSLQHYGIRGMRWGVRRRRMVSADHHAVSSLRGKKLHELSNAELQTISTRMSLEKRYKDLHPSKLKKGAALVTAIIAGTSATIAASQKLVVIGKQVMEYYNKAKQLKGATEGIANMAKAGAKAAKG